MLSSALGQSQTSTPQKGIVDVSAGDGCTSCHWTEEGSTWRQCSYLAHTTSLGLISDNVSKIETAHFNILLCILYTKNNKHIMIIFQLKLLLHFPKKKQVSSRPSGCVFTAGMNTEGFIISMSSPQDLVQKHWP